jgi:integrase
MSPRLVKQGIQSDRGKEWTIRDVPTIVPSMASLFKRPRSRFWFVAFTDANKRRLKKSTKTTDKRLALRIADEFESVAHKRRTILQVRRVIGEMSRDLMGAEMPEPTVRAHFVAWLAAKGPTIAPATRTFYQNATSKFLVWLGERADKDVSLVTRADVVSFRNARAAQASPKTVNHEVKVLRMVFRSARKDGLISDDPAEFAETVRNRNEVTTRRAFTIPELQAVLAVCDDEWKSLVYFGLYTGQRLGDVASLKWSNIDLDRKEIRLTTQKTGKRMIIPISAHLMTHLLSLSAPDVLDAPVHPRAFGCIERTGKTGGLSNQFADILASAGLRKKKAHRKTGEGRGARRDASGLSFHSIRHTAVSLMKHAGIPSAAVMELVGHDSEQMSQHYTHTGAEALEKAAASLPDLMATR